MKIFAWQASHLQHVRHYTKLMLHCGKTPRKILLKSWSQLCCSSVDVFFKPGEEVVADPTGDSPMGTNSPLWVSAVRAATVAFTGRRAGKNTHQTVPLGVESAKRSRTAPNTNATEHEHSRRNSGLACANSASKTEQRNSGISSTNSGGNANRGRSKFNSSKCFFFSNETKCTGFLQKNTNPTADANFGNSPIMDGSCLGIVDTQQPRSTLPIFLSEHPNSPGRRQDRGCSSFSDVQASETANDGPICGPLDLDRIATESTMDHSGKLIFSERPATRTSPSRTRGAGSATDTKGTRRHVEVSLEPRSSSDATTCLSNCFTRGRNGTLALSNDHHSRNSSGASGVHQVGQANEDEWPQSKSSTVSLPRLSFRHRTPIFDTFDAHEDEDFCV